MPLVLTSGPAVEPVTLAEAKAHLRVDGSAEDTLIASLIVTSRLHVEAALGLALITQSWSWFLDAWPPGPARRAAPAPGAEHRRRPPLRRARRRRPRSPRTPTSSTAPASRRAWCARASLAWPTPGRIANGIEIAFTAGYGDAAADVPGPHPPGHPAARRPLVRAPLADRGRRPRRAAVPHMVSELLAPYRRMRL